MKTKKVLALLSVLAILVVGLVAVKDGFNNKQVTNIDIKTVEGKGAMDEQYEYYKGDKLVAHTEEDAASDTGYKLVWDVEESEIGAESVADIIVYYNSAERKAANDVASIVFDFRGYDTIGEALILSTAICGSFCILFKAKKNKEEQA